MALVHEFLLIPSHRLTELVKWQRFFDDQEPGHRYTRRDSVDYPEGAAGLDEILSDYYVENRSQAVGVHDDHILPHLNVLEVVKTYGMGFIPYCGLNYYGDTLIPTESVELFMNILHLIAAGNEYERLLALCRKALRTGQSILHVGI